MITIRAFQAADAAALSQVHNQLFPTAAHTAVSLKQHIRWLQQINGRCWVLFETDQLVGYGWIYPIPGINGLFEIAGGVLPSRQRLRLGSQMLQQIIAELADSDIRQLSHAVTNINSGTALFFKHHHFFIGHEEYQLQRTNIPLPPLKETGCKLRIVDGETAVSLFLKLYNASFSGTRWYQPFTPSEVTTSRKHTDDLLFYDCGDKRIGFVWLRYPKPYIAEIEPIGIVKAYQGKGYGRSLLHQTLHHLQDKGIQQVNLGVWADNVAARHLYHSFGFQHQSTTTYLAYNL